MPLTPSQIRYLRGLAHDVKPVVLLGNKGIHADASDQHFGRTDFATWVIDANARAIAELQVLTSG